MFAGCDTTGPVDGPAKHSATTESRGAAPTLQCDPPDLTIDLPSDGETVYFDAGEPFSLRYKYKGSANSFDTELNVREFVDDAIVSNEYDFDLDSFSYDYTRSYTFSGGTHRIRLRVDFRTCPGTGAEAVTIRESEVTARVILPTRDFALSNPNAIGSRPVFTWTNGTLPTSKTVTRTFGGVCSTGTDPSFVDRTFDVGFASSFTDASASLASFGEGTDSCEAFYSISPYPGSDGQAFTWITDG